MFQHNAPLGHVAQLELNHYPQVPCFDTHSDALLPSDLGSWLPPQLRSPRRLAWPRTSPFHGGNTGSNPVGDANNPKELTEIGILSEGSEGSNNEKDSLGLSHGSLRWQEHFYQFGLSGSFC